MAMVINHNIPALQAYNVVNATQSALSKSIQKLSTGLRINSAADDAAGLAISEKMRAQISGLSKATDNAQDGISMLQTAEGALSETHSILQRMRELSVQAANDTLTAQDRSYIQLEIDQLREEVTRIGNTTQFNTKKLLNGDAAVLWSSSDNSTKAIINGGLRTIDQFGQKSSAEGNYKIEIQADPGTAQVQKSDIFKVKHPNVVMDKYVNKAAGVKDVAVDGVPAAKYVIKTSSAEGAEEYEHTLAIGEILDSELTDLSGKELVIDVDGKEIKVAFNDENTDTVDKATKAITDAIKEKGIKGLETETLGGVVTLKYTTTNGLAGILKASGSATEEKYAYSGEQSVTFTADATELNGMTLFFTSDKAAAGTRGDLGSITFATDAFTAGDDLTTVVGKLTSGSGDPTLTAELEAMGIKVEAGTTGNLKITYTDTDDSYKTITLETDAPDVTIGTTPFFNNGTATTVDPVIEMTGGKESAAPTPLSPASTASADSDKNKYTHTLTTSDITDANLNQLKGRTFVIELDDGTATAIDPIEVNFSATGDADTNTASADAARQAIIDAVAAKAEELGLGDDLKAEVSGNGVEITFKSATATSSTTAIKTSGTATENHRYGATTELTLANFSAGDKITVTVDGVDYEATIATALTASDALTKINDAFDGTGIKAEWMGGISNRITFTFDSGRDVADSTFAIKSSGGTSAFSNTSAVGEAKTYTATSGVIGYSTGDITNWSNTTVAVSIDGVSITTASNLATSNASDAIGDVATKIASDNNFKDTGIVIGDDGNGALTFTYVAIAATPATTSLNVTNGGAANITNTTLTNDAGTAEAASVVAPMVADKSTSSSSTGGASGDGEPLTITGRYNLKDYTEYTNTLTTSALTASNVANLDGKTLEIKVGDKTAKVEFDATDNAKTVTAATEAIAKAINDLKVDGLTAEAKDDGTVEIKNVSTKDTAIELSGDAMSKASSGSDTLTFSSDNDNADFNNAVLTFTDNDGNEVGKVTFTATAATDDVGFAKQINNAGIKGLEAKANTAGGVDITYTDAAGEITSVTAALTGGANNAAVAGGPISLITSPLAAGDAKSTSDGGKTIDASNAITAKIDADKLDRNVNVLLTVTGVDKEAGTVTFNAMAATLKDNGETDTLYEKDIVVSMNGDPISLFTSKDVEDPLAEGALTLTLNNTTPFEVGTKIAYNAAMNAGVTVEVEGEQSDGWSNKWADDVTETTVKYGLDADAVKGQKVHFTNYYINSKTGEVMTGDIILTTDDDVALQPDKTLAKFEAAYIGQTAKTDVALRDLDKFWTSEGVFMLTDAQTVTLTQGDGKQASVTLYGTDTLGEVADKLNDAIATGLGQGQYLTKDGRFVQFVEDPAPSTSESVAGTFVIRSIVPGKNGEISIAASENITNALSLNEIQSSSDTEYTVTVKDAHTDALIANNVKITGNKLVGVINENVDVVFDAMSGVKAEWNDTKKEFEYTTKKATTTLHLSDNTTVFQIGANEGEDMGVNIGDMRATALGLDDVLVTDRKSASRSITVIDNAIDKVSTQRAKLGAYQNRLEHTITNLTTAHENLSSAESRIRDTDMAKEMMNFMKLQITLQAGTSMLAQANQLSQNVLGLLG